MAMSRKHYVEFANMVKKDSDFLTDEQKEKLAKNMASILKRDNPAFNTERFLDACKSA